MSTSTMTNSGQLAPGWSASLLSAVTLRCMKAAANLKQRAEARQVSQQLRAMDDRLLRDIGLDDVEISRLRAGERVIPSSFQP